MSWEAGADLVVIGTGVAGLSAALRARSAGLRVLVVSKDTASAGTTAWAQGGVAVVREERDADDTLDRHVEDTLTSGAGQCSPEAVRAILGDGARAVADLRAAGAQFDRSGQALARTREGGHTAFRVIHAGGDATGAEVQRALSAAAERDGIPGPARHVVAELLRGDGGAVAGALVLDADGGAGVLRAPAVLLATGGLGQLYSATTNPEVATGDGVALALRAGAEVADLEFVQFHPTVLHVPGARGPRPLITEAVRGEGAVLVDAAGEPIMRGEHPQADLAPRDVVSSAINRRLGETGAECAYLDATALDGFADRFPTVSAACRAAGVDPAREPIPVTPAAHYSCGGVVTTVDGRTGVPGLYAAGEVARTGLHGANRLASNSLLEGLVVGARSADAVAADLRRGRLVRQHPAEPRVPAELVVDRAQVQRLMTASASFDRTGGGLSAAAADIARTGVVRPLRTRQAVEDSSLALIAQTLLAAAEIRAESRGCHRRYDFPHPGGDRWQRSVVLRLDVSGWLIHTESDSLETAA